MSSEYDTTETLDVKGQSCPMPIVKTKQAIDDLEAGDVLEVVATDSGSMSDIQGWADGTSGVEPSIRSRETTSTPTTSRSRTNMSTDNQPTAADETEGELEPEAEIDPAELQALRERVDELEESVAESDAADDGKKMTIVATQGPSTWRTRR